MKKFFAYELKKSLFVTVVFAVIATAISVICVLSDLNSVEAGHYELSFEPFIVCAATLGVVAPIWKLSYLMKKRSVDLYYSLPISHVRILAVKFAVGLISVYISVTLGYWIGLFTAFGAIGKAYKILNGVPLYFMLLAAIVAVYTLTAFIFTRAKRLIDGVMFVAMTGMSLGMAAVVALKVISICYSGEYYDYITAYFFNSGYFTPFGIFMIIESYLSNAMFGNLVRIRLSNVDIAGLALVSALSVAAGIGLFVSEAKAKAENCEQISNSVFGYKTMIPLYAFSLAFLSSSGSYILMAIVAVAAYAVSVLYKRSPKIGWGFGIAVFISFALGVGSCLLAWEYLPDLLTS